jgi:thiamine pyrophosphokinase
MTSRVVIMLGGEPPDPRVRRQLPLLTDAVIAADGGIDHAIAWDVPITIAVGDMDSVSLAGLAHLQQERIATERHPADKEASDGELALEVALRGNPEEVHLFTGGGLDRLDHLLITTALLTHPSLAARRVWAWIGSTLIIPLQAGQSTGISGRAGADLTLLAVNGPAQGVRTVGLEFPLHGETLQPSSSRGLSNRCTGGMYHVSIEQGCLLVIRPNAAADLPNIE